MHFAAWLSILVMLVLVAITTTVLSRAMRHLPPAVSERAPAELPPLLVIRPVRGVDHGLEANVAAALAQVYPGPMETLFVLDDESDPAREVIARAIAKYGADARVLIAPPLHRGRTGKLHAMIYGMEAATLDAPLVCFADSDTRP